MIRLHWITFCLIMLTACQQESDPTLPTPVIDPNKYPTVETIPTVSLDRIFGRWTLSTLNGSAFQVADEDEPQAYIEFGPPCYDVGDGHCNDAFDGGWEPSEQREDRLSVRGYTGCNWFGSEAILSGSDLISKPVIATQRGCGNIGPQEAQLLTILSEKPMLSTGDGALLISSHAGSQIHTVVSLPKED